MNSQGRLVDRLDVELKVPGFHHDMFITENYMVLVDGSTRFHARGSCKRAAALELRPGKDSFKGFKGV